jgi:hypothetical protein
MATTTDMAADRSQVPGSVSGGGAVVVVVGAGRAVVVVAGAGGRVVGGAAVVGGGGAVVVVVLVVVVVVVELVVVVVVGSVARVVGAAGTGVVSISGSSGWPPVRAAATRQAMPAVMATQGSQRRAGEGAGGSTSVGMTSSASMVREVCRIRRRRAVCGRPQQIHRLLLYPPTGSLPYVLAAGQRSCSGSRMRTFANAF